MKDLYWVGIKESEIYEIKKDVAGTITIFGSNTGNNIAFDKEVGVRYNYNFAVPDYFSFLDKNMQRICHENPNAHFMFYDNYDLYNSLPQYVKYSVGVQPEELVNNLNDKWYIKKIMNDVVPLMPYKLTDGKSCSLEYCRETFPTAEKFVVQGNYSCGGVMTYLLTEDNENRQIDLLTENEIYAITPYYEQNVSVNVHIVIFKEDILVCPASVQIMDVSDDRFLYSGGDYVAFRFLKEDQRLGVYKIARIVGIKLQKMGYLGICGIDLVIADNTIFFQELNTRFQASTFLLNKYLVSNNLPTLQQLHLEAFEGKEINRKVTELFRTPDIEYSFFEFSYDEKTVNFLHSNYHIFEQCPEIVDVYCDGLDWGGELEEETYLFRAVFNTNISCIDTTGRIRIHPAVTPISVSVKKQYSEEALIRLKILLFNHGIRIDKNAMKYLLEHGGIKFEEFNALNITIFDHIRISVPYHARFTELSPFSIKFLEEKLYLSYCNEMLYEIEVAAADINYHKKTAGGTEYSQLCYFGYDRLRVNYHSGCCLKKIGMGCKFCDVEAGSSFNNFEDLKEVIDAYGKNPQLRHFLVGGGSDSRKSDFAYILKVVEYIHITTNKPIYLMAMPPQNLNVLNRLRELGVTEVAFNIEVFNRNVARNIMPGKGSISLKEYEEVLREATKIWGKSGQVRSALIVGLDSSESLIKGARWLCERGVSPMLSPFRPYACTEYEKYIPASDEEVIAIYDRVSEICRRNKMILGPSCPECEDNIIKISL